MVCRFPLTQYVQLQLYIFFTDVYTGPNKNGKAVSFAKDNGVCCGSDERSNGRSLLAQIFYSFIFSLQSPSPCHPASHRCATKTNCKDNICTTHCLPMALEAFEMKCTKFNLKILNRVHFQALRILPLLPDVFRRYKIFYKVFCNNYMQV